MAELCLPTTRVRKSFLAAMQEFAAEGRGGSGDNSMVGRELRELEQLWSSPEGFAEYVDSIRAAALEDTPRPDGWVPHTTWWLLEGDEYLGRVAVRHRLNDHLRELGGHIGYDIRRSARRRGHATAMLRDVLPEAFALGIDAALITCDTDNEASRRVITNNGGVLDDERNGKLRYWVPTAPSTR